MSNASDLEVIRAVAERGGRRKRAAQAALGAMRPELTELDRELTVALLRLSRSEPDSVVEELQQELQDTRSEVRSLLEKVRC